jgi:hypothetical protein
MSADEWYVGRYAIMEPLPENGMILPWLYDVFMELEDVLWF